MVIRFMPRSQDHCQVRYADKALRTPTNRANHKVNKQLRITVVSFVRYVVELSEETSIDIII